MMTKDEIIVLINMLVTSTIGFFLFMFEGSLFGEEMMRVCIFAGVLLYPAGFFITKKFLKYNIRSRFKGFYMGGIMSMAGTFMAFIPAYCIYIISEMIKSGNASGARGDEMSIVVAIMSLVVGVIFLVAFIIGAISGFVITVIKIKEGEKINEK